MSNKLKVTTIESLAKNQDADGQFSDNKDERRYAAEFVELYLTNFSTIMAHSEDSSTYTVAAINALRDIQVRDYAMGIINDDNINSIMVALNHMIDLTPKKYISAPASLLALAYYETGQTDRAHTALSKAKEDYSLANLLNRVFEAGWSVEMFKRMRQEVHPKVKASIFGEDE
jgi:hypothetical protein